MRRRERVAAVVVACHTLPGWPDVTLIADGAYRSLPNTVIPPPRTEPSARTEHRRVRARIEHVIARLKDWQILRQCRRRSDAINLACRAVDYLYNAAHGLHINS